MVSGSAQVTLRDELLWSGHDLHSFMQCLHPARYLNSEWGLPSGHGGKVPPIPSDAYVMGYNRIKGEENQRTQPWVYFKFGVRLNSCAVLVLSAHPERK
jgi:hypothetical protein